MVFTCSDCGSSFPLYKPKPGVRQCFKCIELSKIDEDKDKSTYRTISKKGQCMKCAIVYARLEKGQDCQPCREFINGETRSSSGVTNKSGVQLPRGLDRHVKKKNEEKVSREVIEILSSDEDTKEFHKRVDTQRKATSSQSLTSKETNLPAATQEYLNKKRKATKNTGSSRISSVILHVTPRIYGMEGQKKGTRVPSELRGFQHDTNFKDCLEDMIIQFNRKGGKWAECYPGKPIVSERVTWTFKLHDASVSLDNFADHTVNHFFECHAAKPGVHISKTDIAARKVNLLMSVPLEDTVSDIEFDDLPSDGKRNRSSKQSGTSRKRPKVKCEELPDIKPDIKTEVVENPKVATQRNNVVLTMNFTFSKMRIVNTKFVESEDHVGLITLLPVQRELQPARSCFRLTVEQEKFHAYRYEGDDARFDQDRELAILQTFLLRRDFLASVVKAFMEKLESDQQISTPEHVFVPEVFIALKRNTDGSIKEMYLCQKASESENDAFAPPSDFLEAISHFSFQYAHQNRLITDLQSCISDDRLAIHGGIVHSKTGDSAHDDDGDAGITFFCDHHVCAGEYCPLVIVSNV